METSKCKELFETLTVIYQTSMEKQVGKHLVQCTRCYAAVCNCAKDLCRLSQIGWDTALTVLAAARNRHVKLCRIVGVRASVQAIAVTLACYGVITFTQNKSIPISIGVRCFHGSVPPKMFCSSIVAQFGEGKNKENTFGSVNNDDGFHAWDSLRSFLGDNRVPFFETSYGSYTENTVEKRHVEACDIGERYWFFTSRAFSVIIYCKKYIERFYLQREYKFYQTMYH